MFRLDEECRRLTISNHQPHSDSDESADDHDALRLDYMTDPVKRTYLAVERLNSVSRAEDDVSRTEDDIIRAVDGAARRVHVGGSAVNHSLTSSPRTPSSRSSTDASSASPALLPPHAFESRRPLAHSTPATALTRTSASSQISGLTEIDDGDIKTAFTGRDVKRVEIPTSALNYDLVDYGGGGVGSYEGTGFPVLTEADIGDIERGYRDQSRDDVTPPQSLSHIERVKVTLDEPRPVKVTKSRAAAATAVARELPAPVPARSASPSKSKPLKNKEKTTNADDDRGTTAQVNEHKDFLMASAIEKFFSQKEIDRVFTEQGYDMSVPDFLQLLHANRGAAPISSSNSRRQRSAAAALEADGGGGGGGGFPRAPSEKELSKPSLQPAAMKATTPAPLGQYYDTLLRDHKVEASDDCSVDQLKANNFKRQQLLRHAMSSGSPSSSNDGTSNRPITISSPVDDVIDVESSDDEDLMAQARNHTKWSKVQKGGKSKKQKKKGLSPFNDVTSRVRGDDNDLPALNRAVRLSPSPARQVAPPPQQQQQPQVVAQQSRARAQSPPRVRADPMASQGHQAAHIPGFSGPQRGKPRYIVIDGSNIAMA